jgi:LCP family protein required for cell wall assembly
MTDDRERVPGRDRTMPPPRQASRQQPPRQQPPRQPQQRQPPPRQQPARQQPPPPAARRSDRGHRAVPPSRHPQPPRRPVAPSDATRAMPTTRRPPRPRDAEPATSPVPPHPAPGNQRPAAPPRGAPRSRSAAAARAAVTSALPTAPPAAPQHDDPEPPTVRHGAVPPARTRARHTATRRRPEPPVEVDDDQLEPEHSFGKALAATAASTVAPGSGHLMLHRTRTGAVILGTFLLVIAVLVILVLTSDTAELLKTALSSNVLVMATVGCVVAALGWVAVIVRTYLLARPIGLGAARQTIGVATVVALCLVVAAPLGFGANLANSQRALLNDLFAGGGGTAAAEAIAKPKLNVMLVGSDAGPDRKGARTDTMMVANIDTKTGRTILFALPRNIQRAQFPPDSPMGEEFPDGFHDPDDPLSGDYLLNAVYAWGQQHPRVAPAGPTQDPGLNLLHETVAYMLGLQLDYYVEVNMAGFESIIDALGGLTIDVGPERIPIGGITPSGRHVRPDGYIEPGVQQLSGKLALDFARSRTGGSDYTRMGRQRCLLQTILKQKSPTDMLANFQSVAAATTNSVSTNIPQAVLPALAALAGNGGVSLESVSFDPSLPDPSEDDGQFSTGDPNFSYMRLVVQDAINRPPPPPAPPTSAAAAPTTRASADDSDDSDDEEESRTEQDNSAAPTSLAESC